MAANHTVSWRPNLTFTGKSKTLTKPEAHNIRNVIRCTVFRTARHKLDLFCLCMPTRSYNADSTGFCTLHSIKICSTRLTARIFSLWLCSLVPMDMPCENWVTALSRVFDFVYCHSLIHSVYNISHCSTNSIC